VDLILCLANRDLARWEEEMDDTWVYPWYLLMRGHECCVRPIFFFVEWCSIRIDKSDICSVAIQGFLMPKLEIDRMIALTRWLERIERMVITWTICSVIIDICVCGLSK
jgi:hypothetical protein